jgi:hypothetical protein
MIREIEGGAEVNFYAQQPWDTVMPCRFFDESVTVLRLLLQETTALSFFSSSRFLCTAPSRFL